MSSSAPQWQVDLPGLSSLVLNMGAAGLKKFAQAGVDVHTLLCMGEIAETCPACPEYRREINLCRQQQRKQSIWLYKVVEIGTASNFIADELLKKRSGENIVALMSTVLPILSEESCEMFILKLFEACKVNGDKTPGYSQLQAFHDSILPLARKTAFKDKVYQHQILLGGLRSSVPEKLSSAVPNVETLVQLVLLFGRLIEDSAYLLSFHGWQGASWVIAYARHVLGLPVCVLRTPQDPVPINGEYQNSRVRVYICDEGSRCELLLAGVIADLIVSTTQDRNPLGHWMVDLDNVNLHDLYLPSCPTYDPAIPGIMSFLVSIFITRLVCAPFGYQRAGYHSTGVQEYLEYCLPQIRRRGLRILDKMGFRVSSDAEPSTNLWEDHLKIRDDGADVFILPGPLWLEFSLAENKFPSWRTSFETLQEGEPLYFTDEGQRIVGLMLMFAEMASLLAISNWGECIRTVSIEAFSHGTRATNDMVNSKDSTKIPTRIFSGHWNTRDGAIVYSLGHDMMHDLPKSGAKYLRYIIFSDNNFPSLKDDLAEDGIAFESQGVVMTLASAERHSIDFEAIWFDFYPGYIHMFGERRSKILQDKGFDSEPFNIRSGVDIGPLNAYPELQIIPELRLRREFIEISNLVLIQDKLLHVHGPTFGDLKLTKPWVTASCSHDYYTTLRQAPSANVYIQTGLYPAGGKRPDSAYDNDLWIFLAAVDQNPAGQWISVQNPHGLHGNLREPRTFILQRDMCTPCTIDLIRIMHEQSSSLIKDSWYIVPARLKGEAIPSATRT
ncbi:MAG: hypothetical protein Q9172_007388 [Xanthocarpia lactea]